MCLPVLKESNKSSFDSYSRQKQCIDHIPYYLSGLARVLFSDNLTRDQALFSFRFENYIPAGMAKRKESLIRTFYETFAAHFFDWLTFAESANQNYFRSLFF